MAEIVTLGLVHARCLECRWVGEGFLTSAEARDDAEMWHVHRCPGPVQANADEYPTSQDSAKPEHRCLDPRAGTLRLEGGRCFWCGEQVDPPAQDSETGENR